VTALEGKLAELAKRFAERLPEERRSIADALSAGDREALIDRTHKLAGIAGMFGQSEIGAAAQELEQRILADADFGAEAARLLDLLERP
jgi:HPt (histidine-containing phosphotransfer) domain-containing protein